MKKLLSLILALTFVMSVFSSITAFAVEETEESVFVVATDYEEVFGLDWYTYPSDNNVMTKTGDVYTLTVDNIPPTQKTISFTVVENTPRGYQNTYGYDFVGTQENYAYYRVFETTSITFTFDPETEEIDVIGDGVRRVTGNNSVRAYGVNTDALVHGEQDLFHYKGEMTLGDDGIYAVTFKDVEPTENIIIDVDTDFHFNLQIVGFYGYNYYAIDVVEKCDVTVYFKADNHFDSGSVIWATGDGVVERTKPLIGDLYVYGYWSGYECTDRNRMVEVAENVYRVTIPNVEAGQKSFSIINATENFSDKWYNFGTFQLGVDHNACMYPIVLQPTTMGFESPFKNSNVTITLDLTDFDYVTKDGATFRIDATDMRGDLNVDGIVTIADATDVQKGLANLITFTENQKISGDVNGDGEVTIVDVTIIQKYITKLVESFDNIE